MHHMSVEKQKDWKEMKKKTESTDGLDLSDVSTEDDHVRDYEQCGCEIGCGGCKTKRCTINFLSCFNNPKWALFFLCLAVFSQGFVVNGLINIVISTLEKRFHLRSSETGFIAGCYDIGVLISLPVVTYIGGRGHRPLWLGSGLLIMGLGSFVFALPHFLAPMYSIDGIDGYSCNDNSSSTCGEQSIRVYRGFFMLSQLLHGIGASPLFTIAITYLDANVKQSSSSIYHGILIAFSLFGPGVGYLLGGRFLTLFTNLNEAVEIAESSPLWVGNWWLGFLVAGAFSMLISIPILMYPTQLPGTDKYRLDREKEMHQNEGAVSVEGDDQFGRSIKDAPRCLLIILRIPTLVFISLAGAMDSGMAIALATFGPKYIEAMFSLSASAAALYFGVATILSASIAQLLGGWIVSKFKFTVLKMIKFSIMCSCTAFALFFVFLLKCENRKIAGVNVPFNGESSVHCQSTCGCSTELFNPVCGADDLTYLSFCDAGCTKESGAKDYTNCTRVLESNGISLLQNATASSGKCVHDTSCPNVGILLFFAGLAVFFTFLKGQPALQASLRCVPFAQRSFSIGIQWVFIRICGSIPIPIILGKVLDLSCLVWGVECGECGSCKVYDNASMANYMTILATAAKGLSIIFLILAWKTYKPPPEAEKMVEENSASSPELNKSSEVEINGINGIEMNENSRNSKTSEYDNRAFSP